MPTALITATWRDTGTWLAKPIQLVPPQAGASRPFIKSPCIEGNFFPLASPARDLSTESRCASTSNATGTRPAGRGGSARPKRRCPQQRLYLLQRRRAAPDGAKGMGMTSRWQANTRSGLRPGDRRTPGAGYPTCTYVPLCVSRDMRTMHSSIRLRSAFFQQRDGGGAEEGR